MMAALVLGVLALIAILFLGQLFAGADPKLLAKMLRYTGAALLGLAALALFTVDRVGVGMLLGSMAWGLYTGGRVWPGGWPYFGHHHPHGSGGAAPGDAGQATRVRTDWLELELDHATGAMQGRVLKGRYAGQSLARMSLGVLIAFHREAASDPETVRLIETYLDRNHGAAWRKASQNGKSDAGQAGKARGDRGMSREEAFAVLGLQPGASDDDIRAAHRKLMLQNHPDRGGSDYLAAKINEAKDVLLG